MMQLARLGVTLTIVLLAMSSVGCASTTVISHGYSPRRIMTKSEAVETLRRSLPNYVDAPPQSVEEATRIMDSRASNARRSPFIAPKDLAIAKSTGTLIVQIDESGMTCNVYHKVIDAHLNPSGGLYGPIFINRVTHHYVQGEVVRGEFAEVTSITHTQDGPISTFLLLRGNKGEKGFMRIYVDPADNNNVISALIMLCTNLE